MGNPSGQARKLHPSASLGFTPYNTFEELCGPGKGDLTSRLSALYKGKIEDVDLWVGVMCERQSEVDFFPQVTQALLAQVALNTVPAEMDKMKVWVRSQGLGNLLKDKTMLNLKSFIKVNLPPSERGVNGPIFMRFPSKYCSTLFPSKKFKPDPSKQAPTPTPTFALKNNKINPEPPSELQLQPQPWSAAAPQPTVPELDP